MCVHDIQRLFEGAILDMANNFTVKRRHIIPVFVQNCDRGGTQTHGRKSISDADYSNISYWQRTGLSTEEAAVGTRLQRLSWLKAGPLPTMMG